MDNEEIEGIFGAVASSVYNLFNDEEGKAGFKVPIYQRRYDWDKQNVKRLLEDIAMGIAWRVDDVHALTFIGTIIVVEDENGEDSFRNGKSLGIVDGQQRITTIILIAIVLYESLYNHWLTDKYQMDDESLRVQLEEEVNVVLGDLLSLICGELSPKKAGGKISPYPFPRLVRADSRDNRADSYRMSEYNSPVSMLSAAFVKTVNSNQKETVKNSINFIEGYNEFDKKEGAIFVRNNLDFIISFFSNVDKEDGAIPSYDVCFLAKNDFQRAGVRDLFNLSDKITNTDRNKFFSKLSKSDSRVLSSIRLVSFANYLLQGVVVAYVRIKEDRYGFDIFDSLNTTGEPLTAIQTFKPQVIKYTSDNHSDFSQAKEFSHFLRIEGYIDAQKTASKKQSRSKDVVRSVALYVSGKKVANKPDEQRRWLRNEYNKICHKDKAKERFLKASFTKAIVDIVEFRKRIWDVEDISGGLPAMEGRDVALLCLGFLKDIDMYVSIPILTRIFTSLEFKGRLDLYPAYVKAYTCYVILRRGATKNTANIDGEVRKMMSSGRVKDSDTQSSIPLSLGLRFDRDLVSLDLFKQYLREYLSAGRLKLEGKDDWVRKMNQQPLYDIAKPLCRFILLAAANNSRQSDKSFLLTRKGVKGADQLEVLTYKMWKSESVETVEHIAPVNPKGKWDKQIYIKDRSFVDSIGNLTLLPGKENSVLGNRPWAHKKILMKAFAQEDEAGVTEVLDEAAKVGLVPAKQAKALIRDNYQLPLAESISRADEWNVDTIQKRGENIGQLAWDEISTWLYD